MVQTMLYNPQSEYKTRGQQDMITRSLIKKLQCMRTISCSSASQRDLLLRPQCKQTASIGVIAWCRRRQLRP